MVNEMVRSFLLHIPELVNVCLLFDCVHEKRVLMIFLHILIYIIE